MSDAEKKARELPPCAKDQAALDAEELLSWEAFSCETADEDAYEKIIDRVAAKLRMLLEDSDKMRIDFWRQDAEIATLRAEIETHKRSLMESFSREMRLHVELEKLRAELKAAQAKERDEHNK